MTTILRVQMRVLSRNETTALGYLSQGREVASCHIQRLCQHPDAQATRRMLRGLERAGLVAGVEGSIRPGLLVAHHGCRPRCGSGGRLMGKILKDERINQRRVVVNFSNSELRNLIGAEAMRIAGADGCMTKMTIRQEERGSPSYRIDEWTVTVTITVECDR